MPSSISAARRRSPSGRDIRSMRCLARARDELARRPPTCSSTARRPRCRRRPARRSARSGASKRRRASARAPRRSADRARRSAGRSQAATSPSPSAARARGRSIGTRRPPSVTSPSSWPWRTAVRSGSCLPFGPTTSSTSASMISCSTPEPDADAQRQQALLRGAGQLAQRLLHPLGQRARRLLLGGDLSGSIRSSSRRFLLSSWTCSHPPRSQRERTRREDRRFNSTDYGTTSSRARAGPGGVDRFVVGWCEPLSGGGGERSDAVQRVEVVAVPGPAGREMQRPAAGVAGQAAGDASNRRRSVRAARTVVPGSPSTCVHLSRLWASAPSTVHAALAP